MKVLAVVLALAVFGINAAPQDGKDVAGDVTNAINKILEEIPEPLLDVHDQDLTVDLVVEKIVATLNDLELTGIKNLEIKQMDYDDSTGRLDYDLTFGEVVADIDFELVLSGLIALEHHPSIEVDLTDLKLSGYAVVDTDSEPNQLTDFQFLVSLGGAKVDLKNILNDDELTESLTTLLNETLVDIVGNIAKSLEPVVSPIIQSAINIILRHTEST